MRLDDVYALTEAGHAQLRGGATTLRPNALALLVRFDGFLTLGEIGGGLAEPGMASLLVATRQLVDAGLLQRAETDPFALEQKADLRRMQGEAQGMDARAAFSSLQRTGFFVQIARSRVPAGPRERTVPAILLIEDDPLIARFTRTYLGLNGFEVRTAGNRAEALQVLRKRPVPDLILLDVALPDVDGFDVLLRLRQHADFEQVPVVMLTGTATRDGVLRGLRQGADGYVTKPCEPDALIRVVRHVLQLPEHPGSASPSGGPWSSIHAR
jgi:CheY-like chemotaxis protein